MSCLACALLAATIASADARTRRERRSSAFKVALQPFSLVRDAVHAVADPIIENAPRAVARVATAPARIAATTARMLPRDEEEYDGRSDEQDEEVYPSERGQTARPVRAAEPSGYGEPVRVAYVTAQPVRRAEPAPQAGVYDDGEEFNEAAPRDEQGFAAEVDEENEATPENSWPGDRPTVQGSRAVLRNGIAYAPSRAPQNVKNAIWAVNALRRKPYRWGG